MKRLISIILSVLLLTSAVSISAVNAEEVEAGIAFNTSNALYVHAVTNSDDMEAWQGWQSAHDENAKEINADEKYFFLPTSADSEKVDIYNAFSDTVTVNGTEIEAGKTKSVSYEQNKIYRVNADNTSYKLRFMKSNAEAAIYVNNSNADGNGTDLISYLNTNKEFKASA